MVNKYFGYMPMDFNNYIIVEGKMKIERPDWYPMLGIGNGPRYTERVSREKLDQWFDNHIEPINKMLADGVEVYGYNDVSVEYEGEGWCFAQSEAPNDTHKALLVDIQSIRKKSREQQLEEFVKEYQDLSKSIKLKPELCYEAYYERLDEIAKALLEEK